MANTKQMEQTRDDKGRITGGPPPKGFNANPQNRHNGAWKKEETVRYQVEMVAQMGDEELQEVIDDVERPRLVRNFASAVKMSQWREIKEMIEMIYGKPKESVDLTSNGESVGLPTIRIIDERKRKA